MLVAMAHMVHFVAELAVVRSLVARANLDLQEQDCMAPAAVDMARVAAAVADNFEDN